MDSNVVDKNMLYTLADAARVLGCHPGTIKAWVDSGKLGGTRLSDGSRVVYGKSLAEVALRLSQMPKRQLKYMSLRIQ